MPTATVGRLAIHPAARAAWDAWRGIRRRGDDAAALTLGECLAIRGNVRLLVVSGFDVLEAAEAAPAEQMLRVLVLPPLPDAEVERRAWFEVIRLLGLQLDRRDGPPTLLRALEKLPLDLSRALFGRDQLGRGQLAQRLGTSKDLVSGRLGRLRGRG
jgi:hypothetical protein